MPLNKLKPEEKVKLSIDMTDVCASVCADAVKDQGVVKGTREDLQPQLLS